VISEISFWMVWMVGSVLSASDIVSSATHWVLMLDELDCSDEGLHLTLLALRDDSCCVHLWRMT
jgi:hypothetical protein